jgi:hypothetical protein
MMFDKTLFIHHMTLYTSSGIPFVNYFEDKFLSKLFDKLGYYWAVQIGDFSILITAELSTFFLMFFLLPFLLRNNHSYSYRFSDELEGFVYMWAERKGIKDVIIERLL